MSTPRKSGPASKPSPAKPASRTSSPGPALNEHGGTVPQPSTHPDTSEN